MCCGTLPFIEYQQHMFLWRNKQNYPLIITKYMYPPYLFHFNKVRDLALFPSYIRLMSYQLLEFSKTTA